MLTNVARALQLFRETRNPVPIVLDRMSLARAPYCMQTKDGLRFELRPQRGDRFGFYEVLVRGDYTRFGQTIAPGATVIDIGANVGCFSILAARLAGPQGRVIAVEPDWAMPPLPVDSAIRLSVFTLVGAMLLTMLMPAP